jgi:peptidoglycan hydrolase-like protein with peptidoglycan-binding domain
MATQWQIHSIPYLHEEALVGPEVYPWDEGSRVAEVQELLCAFGFRLLIDGIYGNSTEIALKSFQRRNDLRIDGIVGPKTWAALKSMVEPGTRRLRKGHTGADVAALQGLLHVNGFLALKRDGIFGTKTHQALVEFQRQHKLRDNGIVGPVTWTVLQGARR